MDIGSDHSSDSDSAHSTVSDNDSDDEYDDCDFCLRSIHEDYFDVCARCGLIICQSCKQDKSLLPTMRVYHQPNSVYCWFMCSEKCYILKKTR